MNYPNRYTGGTKKKIFLRILVVFLSLTAVCALTLAYGNYLKSKAERSRNDSYSGAGRPIDAERDTDSVEQETTFSKSENVKSACIVLDYFEDVETLHAYMDTLAADGYTGITTVLVGRDGYLTYASEAVAKYTHQRPSAAKDGAFIGEMISKARELSMRTSAAIFTSDAFASDDISAQIDALCCADAAAFGFDEIIAVIPVTAEEINSDVSNRVLSYIDSLAAQRGSSLLGIALDDGIYRTPSLSPQTEMFASGADFLAIDMTDVFASTEDAASFVSGIAGEISGSFTVYGLRALFDGANAEISAAQTQALADASFSNYMFVDAPPLPEPDTTDTTDIGDGPDAPTTDAPATDAPATDEPATDEPATDAPATDEPTP